MGKKQEREVQRRIPVRRKVSGKLRSNPVIKNPASDLKASLGGHCAETPSPES